MTEFRFRGWGRRRPAQPDTWIVITDIKPLTAEEKARVAREDADIKTRRDKFGLY